MWDSYVRISCISCISCILPTPTILPTPRTSPTSTIPTSAYLSERSSLALKSLTNFGSEEDWIMQIAESLEIVHHLWILAAAPAIVVALVGLARISRIW